MNTTKSPYVAWRLQHPDATLEPSTLVRINQWVDISHSLNGLLRSYYDSIEPWLEGKTNRSPDLVSFIAGYGRSVAVIGDWKDLPIAIPDSELENWRENTSLAVTLEELREWQAGIAGIVPEVLHLQLEKSIKLIRAQLKKRYTELEELTQRPIESFAPTQWHEDMVGEEELGQEVQELDRIFDLYEELWCFQQGIEPLRMIMITEDDPEFHLPSQTFYDALLSIDSHELLSNLRDAEPKLKQVLKMWSETIMTYSGEPYHRPYDPLAPKEFWWRHRARRGTTVKKPVHRRR